jgi:hypothetical protein
MTRRTPHALRTSVRAEPLITHPYDYADSFEIDVPPTESRTPEQLFRAALDRPLASGLRWIVPLIHRRLLALRLGPSVSGDHILGWPILTSDTDVVHLQAGGPLLDGTIVGRRLTPERLSFSTFVRYNHGMLTRVIWAITSPLHRAVAPFLLEQGAAALPAESRSESPGPPS